MKWICKLIGYGVFDKLWWCFVGYKKIMNTKYTYAKIGVSNTISDQHSHGPNLVLL